MEPELVFYTHPASRGRIVRWMLEEVGSPYCTEVLEYGTTMKAPEFLGINPMGKVPAIRLNGVVVTEAAAVCATLADAFPAAGLAPPPDDPSRGAYYRWLFFGAGPLEAAVCNKGLGVEVPPGRDRMTGYGTFEQTMAVVEQTLAEDGFIAGDSFSAADVYVGSLIGMGMMFGLIGKRPAFERYVARLDSRPAALRAKAIDDALMAQPA